MKPPIFLALITAAILVAGCSGHSDFVPEKGTEYVFETSTGTKVTFTYEGVIENAGQEWYNFDQENSLPYPLDTMAYLSKSTGGLAYATDSSGTWEKGFARPFMEWHHSAGIYLVSAPDGVKFHVNLENDGKDRTVLVEAWRDGKLLNKGEVKYREGDLMPYHVEKWNARQPDGTWDVHGWAKRDP